MALENILYGIFSRCIPPSIEIAVAARAFNSEHQVFIHLHPVMLSIIDILQMDLINECSLRFAEDKDFRLLVRTKCKFYYV